jgi:hypothetical protein
MTAPRATPDEPDEPRLEVRAADVLAALATFAGSTAVVAYGMGPNASFAVFLGLHLAVLTVPSVYLCFRAYARRELTMPALLVITTAAGGPVGALGCAALALAFRLRRPAASRLQAWYDYISGVVARGRVTQIYDELAAGRLPTDRTAAVPRFQPIMQEASVDEQQLVLGVIGRRYHADFRPVLRRALRDKNGFIRAQAAAVASRLDLAEKSLLWSAGTPERPDARAAGSDDDDHAR